ncbi:MAG: PEP/pyruvate-binding domain-containing protein [Syntrophobacterales bacterium]
MNHVLSLADIRPRDRRVVGGKGFSLAVLAQQGLRVPATLVVTTRAYEHFVSATGLKGRLLLELRRKNFKDLRWEEMWDASLRIRHLFLNQRLPADLDASLREALAPHLPERCVVRSSAPGEDSRQASFAGLHASFVNVAGLEAVLEHLKLVWASLWSDAALLYRRELGLDVKKSAMAVLVQDMVAGEKSGVVFGQNPQDPSQAVIEAVYGLNQGLVDGTVEPDRWILDRETGAILTYHPAPKHDLMLPGEEGVRLAPLLSDQTQVPPLTEAEVAQVHHLARRSEVLFGTPQDMEWTFAGEELVTLQSRPITTNEKGKKEDQRPWYLSLRRSFGNLKALRQKVEGQLIPALQAEAVRLTALPLDRMADTQLKEEIILRGEIYRHWKGVYWDDFIPLAHGIRLFGMVYNDAVKPADPYEFLNLLGVSGMLSLNRNQLLMDMAAKVKEQPELLEELRTGMVKNQELNQVWQSFLREFGDLFCGTAACPQGPEALASLIQMMAAKPPRVEQFTSAAVESLKENFLSRFSRSKRTEMAEYLDLARASYRLRDDDNLHLGKITGQFLKAVEEYRRRREQSDASSPLSDNLPTEVREILAELEEKPPPGESGQVWKGFTHPQARQMVGQPASPGLAQGPALVVLESSELFHFKAGDILVVDSLDPSMTFVAPLAAGIVERRGGMLIHGSIIAREYGIPCVTGVPNATSLIHTGDAVTVDGYLGIVIIG